MPPSYEALVHIVGDLEKKVAWLQRQELSRIQRSMKQTVFPADEEPDTADIPVNFQRIVDAIAIIHWLVYATKDGYVSEEQDNDEAPVILAWEYVEKSIRLKVSQKMQSDEVNRIAESYRSPDPELMREKELAAKEAESRFFSRTKEAQVRVFAVSPDCPNKCSEKRHVQICAACKIYAKKQSYKTLAIPKRNCELCDVLYDPGFASKNDNLCRKCRALTPEEVAMKNNAKEEVKNEKQKHTYMVPFTREEIWTIIPHLHGEVQELLKLKAAVLEDGISFAHLDFLVKALVYYRIGRKGIEQDSYVGQILDSMADILGYVCANDMPNDIHKFDYGEHPYKAFDHECDSLDDQCHCDEPEEDARNDSEYE